MPEETQIGVEGDSMVVTLSARGNPTNIAYTWSKEGIPLTKKSLRILADGPSLNFTRLSRNDSGVYACEASNAEGQSVAHINVSVHCECFSLVFLEKSFGSFYFIFLGK